MNIEQHHRTHSERQDGMPFLCDSTPFPPMKMSPDFIHYPVLFLLIMVRVPSALDPLENCFSKQPCPRGKAGLIIPILQVVKLRPRVVKWLAQGLTNIVSPHLMLSIGSATLSEKMNNLTNFYQRLADLKKSYGPTASHQRYNKTILKKSTLLQRNQFFP